MSGQQKISCFFSTSQKRASADSENTPPKKVKLDNSEAASDDKSPQDGSKTLSPEQKQKMEDNRLQALAKLHMKQTNGLLVDIGESWMKALEPEFKKTYFTELGSFVAKERQKGTVYPPPENVFTWTRACTLQQVKVIILGQDPYHGPNQAHGLSFSVQPGVSPPPSLVNMYKELAKDIEGFQHPQHGYLMGWARQGVLMLNAVLTVRAHQANSHKDKGWEKLTDAVVAYFNKNRTGIVFILWGAYAQKKGAQIDKTNHHVIKGVHPSPLSAHKGFFGCKHFSKCNEYLVADGKTRIDWCDLPRK